MSGIAKVTSKKTTSNKGELAPKAKKPDLSSTKDSPFEQALDLQRTVGNQAVESLFKSGIIQPKLKIGQPGDKYELEADRIAEQVMRMPDSVCPTCMEEEIVNRKVIQRESFSSEESSFVQRQVGEEERKKKEEEEIIQPKFVSSQITPLVQRQIEDTERKKREEEEKMLQTKENSSGTAEVTPSIESSVNSLKGGGQPFSESLRNYFEPRFGYDFSGVRVYTGSEAAEAASSINARAFTVGNNVIFGSSSYSPETGEGKKLLAHELTHYIQQKGGERIQRATDPNYVVKGKYPAASKHKNKVYFEFSEAVPDSDEEAKIVDIAKTKKTEDFELVGYASEEGSDASNMNLAARRAREVDRIMAREKHSGIRNKKNEYKKGEYKIIYSNMRRVDIEKAGAASLEPSCEVTTAVPRPEMEACNPKFVAAHPIAIKLINKALSEMILAYFPLYFWKRAWIDHVITTIFGDASYYDQIFGHLLMLNIQVVYQVANHECHNTCDSGCATARAYMPGGASGLGSLLTLCPSFHKANDIKAAYTLIHEAGHVTPGLETEDHAYEEERGIVFLSSSEALKNTDSYVLFIKELNTPGSVVKVTGTTRDNIDPTITNPTEIKNLRRVMAYLEKWILGSVSEVSSVYDTIKEVRQCTPPSWSCASNSYYEESMKFIADIFGLRKPTIIPKEEDQVAVVGIFHRIIKMFQMLWKKDIDIKRDDTGSTRFSSGPASPLYVNSFFLSSGQPAMLDELSNKSVEAHTEITSGHKPKYVALIKKVSDHAGLLRP